MGPLVPESGRTCLGLEYFCSRGDEIWQSDDASLIALATKELDALGLGQGAVVLDAVVVRAPDAYPVYDSTYADHLGVLRGFLDPISNLHTVGRNGMHKYNNQDHSMYAAMLTVANLHGESHDVWSVNTDLEYHELQRMHGGAAGTFVGNNGAPVPAPPSRVPGPKSPIPHRHNSLESPRGCWPIASHSSKHTGGGPGTAPQSRLKRARRTASTTSWGSSSLWSRGTPRCSSWNVHRAIAGRTSQKYDSLPQVGHFDHESIVELDTVELRHQDIAHHRVDSPSRWRSSREPPSPRLASVTSNPPRSNSLRSELLTDASSSTTRILAIVPRS